MDSSSFEVSSKREAQSAWRPAPCGGLAFSFSDFRFQLFSFSAFSFQLSAFQLSAFIILSPFGPWSHFFRVFCVFRGLILFLTCNPAVLISDFHLFSFSAFIILYSVVP